MKFNFSFYDISYYFKKNRKIYFFFLIFFIVGIVAGVFIAISSNSFSSLLTSSNKIFYDYVNGKVGFGEQTAKLILNSLVFKILIFLLCFNYYSGLVSYLLISYQSTLFLLSIIAVVSEFGFSGVVLSLVLIMPINLVLILNNIIFSGICLSRSQKAHINKMFNFGFNDKFFWFGLLLCFAFVIVFSCLINLLILMILKSRIFLIF